jgi:Flp pilus assembly protein TadD
MNSHRDGTEVSSPAAPGAAIPQRAAPFFAGAWPLAILLLLAVLPYVGILRNDFAYAYDDKAQILDNPTVHNFHHLRELLTKPIWQILGAQPLASYYRPVATVEFLLCYQLFGPWACGFHLISLLLNAFVVALVFAIASRVMGDRRAAFAAAVIFALIPVHVEVVAWISAAMDLDLAFFYFLTFWCFLWIEDRAGRRRLYALVAMTTSYALTLLSKEPAVMLPVLATIYEHWYRGDRAETTWGQKLLRYGPLWLVDLGYAIARVRIFGEFARPPGLHPLSLPQVLLSALTLIGEYFALLLFPVRLSALYVFHASTRIDWHVLAGALAMIVTAAAFGVLWKRARPATFAILWFFITLAPVLDARWMGVYVLADRYLYVPSLGFSLVAGWACWALWRAAASRGGPLRTYAVAAACLLAALCVLRISTRVREWQSDVTILSQASAAEPGDYRIHDGLGLAYWIRGDAVHAEREWQATLRLEPNSSQTLEFLGALYAQKKRFDLAVPLLERSILLNPKSANAHLNLGAAYAELGNLDRAEEQFRAAVLLSYLNFNAHNLLGKLYFDSKRFGEAEQQFRLSLQCEPNLAAYDHLGYIYVQWGDRDRAVKAFKAALAMNSADSHAHFNLGLIYAATGRNAQAVEELQAALAADPNNPEILSALEKLRR